MPDEEDYPTFVPPILCQFKRREKLFAKSGVTVKDAIQQAEGNEFQPFKLNQKAKFISKYKTTERCGL